MRAGGVRRRWLWLLMLPGFLGAILWFVLCLRFVAHPEIDRVGPVEALFVLGPAEYRIDQARTWAEEVGAEALIVTVSVNTQTGAVYEKDFCDPQPYEVICVQPDPYTTQGEAQLLARLVEERGWERVAVMTSTPHVARARLWMERYVDAEVRLWEHVEPMTWQQWFGQFVYQSAAWAKAMLTRD